MSQIDFKRRFSRATDRVRQRLELIELKSNRLYTPVWRNKAYRWISPLDSDGLLVASRPVLSGETFNGAAEPRQRATLRIGVVLQSESATAQSKPNPLGKALIGRLPLGAWTDLKEGSRVRLDECYVLFVVPQGQVYEKKKKSRVALQNVINAAELSVTAWYVPVPLGAGEEQIADAILKVVNPWLRGGGRLPGT